MTARAAVWSLLRDDPQIASLGAEQIYATNAVDSPPEECFVVIKWDNTQRVYGDRRTNNLAVWVHDRNRDYGRIGDVLRRVEDLLASTVHLAGEDGWTLTQADWLGQGPDLYDGGYESCTKYSNFFIVSRKTDA